MRKIHDGNELWKSYCRLNRSEIEDFKKALVINKIHYSTFYKDSKPEKNLLKIPVARERFYLKCFPDLERVFSGQSLPPAYSREKEARKKLREQLIRKLNLSK